jgi:hypothetical protein
MRNRRIVNIKVGTTPVLVSLGVHKHLLVRNLGAEFLYSSDERDGNFRLLLHSSEWIEFLDDDVSSLFLKVESNHTEVQVITW